jgi:hypothetical protein
MIARPVLLAVLISSLTSFGAPRDDARSLNDQVDRQLRECRTSLVLKPKLEVLPQALKLKVLVMRGTDRAVLGSITTKAGGSNRTAQVRALVAQVCREAGLLA